jgi:Protein of unknown function (DUF1295)
MFLHFVGDAQKYYTLRFWSGLIEDGLFARTRNPNYLGETLIYISFATVSWALAILSRAGEAGSASISQTCKEKIDPSLGTPILPLIKRGPGCFFPPSDRACGFSGCRVNPRTKKICSEGRIQKAIRLLVSSVNRLPAIARLLVSTGRVLSSQRYGEIQAQRS